MRLVSNRRLRWLPRDRGTAAIVLALALLGQVTLRSSAAEWADTGLTGRGGSTNPGRGAAASASPDQLKLRSLDPSLVALPAQAWQGMLSHPIRGRSLTATKSLPPSQSPEIDVHSLPLLQDWHVAGPGPLKVPILLYHHVDPTRPAGKYNVDPEKFQEQMLALVDAGFTTISTETLRDAILHETPIPLKPLLITFDDGDESNYTNAFPILNGYGLSGVVYVVADRLWSPGFLSVDELEEMSAAGWEVGGHSMTHADLTTLSGDELRREIVGSKQLLERNLGVEITSFAYPFGSFNPAVAEAVKSAGYESAMGCGKSVEQSSGNLYYLSRITVDGSWSMDEFSETVGMSERP